jgi:hypothetical protein
VEDEPAGRAEDIAGVLDDAEPIVAAATPEVIEDLDRERRPWWRRLRRRRDPGDNGGGFRLSNR